MKLNEKIMNLRKKEGLSQEELAEKLNVTRQTVSKWELGTITPKMDKLTEMSKIFNTTVDDLINEEDSNVEEPVKQEDNTIRKDELNNNKRKWVIVLVIIALIVLIVYGIRLVLAELVWNNAKDSVLNTAGQGVQTVFDLFNSVTNKMDEKNNAQANQMNEEYNAQVNQMQESYDAQVNKMKQEQEEAYQKALKAQKEYMEQAQKEQQKATEEGLKASQEMLKNINK